jgi:hypothetical protein
MRHTYTVEDFGKFRHIGERIAIGPIPRWHTDSSGELESLRCLLTDDSKKFEEVGRVIVGDDVAT